MAIVKGFGAGQGVGTDQTFGFNATNATLIREVGSAVFYLDPDRTPFILLTDAIGGSESAENPRFEWYEKALRERVSTLDAASDVDGSAVTTSLVTPAGGSANIFKIGDLVWNTNVNEIYRVTAQPGARTYTVTRGAAGSSATNAAAAGNTLVVVGNAQAEGANVGIPDEWQATHEFNFTNIYRSPFGASRTREASASYVGKPRSTIMGEVGVLHAMDIERSYLWSGRSEDTGTANAVVRTTGGFRFFATSNSRDLVGATLSEPDVEDWMEDLFAHVASGDSRLLLSSAPVVTAFDMMAVNKLETVSDPNLTYGIAVRRYQTAHGNFNIVKHRLLAEGGAGYASGAIAIDVKKLKDRPLAGGATKLLKNRQTDGIDGWVDEYLTESGFQLANREVHGTLLNVGAAA